MLDQYFVRPESADRLRGLWLGPAIERYAEWLASRPAAQATASPHPPSLGGFDQFAQRRGVQRWDELPALVEDFVRYSFRRHGKWCQTLKDRRTVRSQSRAP